MDLGQNQKGNGGKNSKMCCSRYRRLSLLSSNVGKFSNKKKILDILKWSKMTQKKWRTIFQIQTYQCRSQNQQLELHYQFFLKDQIQKVENNFIKIFVNNLTKKYGTQGEKISNILKQLIKSIKLIQFFLFPLYNQLYSYKMTYKVNQIYIINYKAPNQLINVCSQLQYLTKKHKFVFCFMPKKSKFIHNSHFCQKSHPLIERLIKEISEKNEIDNNLKAEICDELQLLQASEDDDICQCRKALCIFLQAVNIKKWLKLLFSDHESKFHKYLIRIPLPYQQLKTEIMELVNNLQTKIISTVYYNKKQQSLKCSKKRKPITKSKTSRVNKLGKVKKQTYHESEYINYVYQAEQQQGKYIKMEDMHRN